MRIENGNDRALAVWRDRKNCLIFIYHFFQQVARPTRCECRFIVSRYRPALFFCFVRSYAHRNALPFLIDGAGVIAEVVMPVDLNFYPQTSNFSPGIGRYWFPFSGRSWAAVHAKRVFLIFDVMFYDVQWCASARDYEVAWAPKCFTPKGSQDLRKLLCSQMTR